MIDFDLLFSKSSERLKKNWAKAAHFGWYMNWHTPIHYAKKASRQEIDELMINHIKIDLKEIIKSISFVCPDRMQILDVAFNLHRYSVYFASIPLFLAQAEGIFQDGFGTGIFSRGKKKLNSVLSADLGNVFKAILFSTNEDTQFRAQTTTVSQHDKDLAPNRHGILHGNKDYLDYGSHINSCKSISLLAYTAFMSEVYESRKT
jgi:hypothetical protein